MDGTRIDCRKVNPDIVFVRVSERKYRIAKVERSNGFQHGFTGVTTGAWMAEGATFSYNELLEWLQTHPQYTSPDVHILTQ